MSAEQSEQVGNAALIPKASAWPSGGVRGVSAGGIELGAAAECDAVAL